MFADDTNITASRDCVEYIELAVNLDLENLRKLLVANS